jgi:hypothetical protein
MRSAREDAGEDCPKPVFGRYRQAKPLIVNRLQRGTINR